MPRTLRVLLVADARPNFVRVAPIASELREINRVLTDQISDLLFTTDTGADDNLRREGIDQGRSTSPAT